MGHKGEEAGISQSKGFRDEAVDAKAVVAMSDVWSIQHEGEHPTGSSMGPLPGGGDYGHCGYWCLGIHKTLRPKG